MKSAIELGLCLLLSVGSATAQTGNFCAINPSVNPNLQCFDTEASAMEYLRSDPAPYDGRDLLKQWSETVTYSNGVRSIERQYRVDPKPYESPFVVWFNAFKGNPSAGPDYNEPEPPAGSLDALLPGEGVYGWLSQEELASRLDTREGRQGQFNPQFLTVPNTAWDGFRSHPAGGQRLRVRLDYDGSGVSYEFNWVDSNGIPRRIAWNAHKRGRAWCPAGYFGFAAGMCTNSQVGTLVIREPAHETCETAKPCAPASGAKLLHEVDFNWGIWNFTRHYSSVASNTADPPIGANWSHSFSARMIPADVTSTTHYGFDEKRNFEMYSNVSGTMLRSENETGRNLVRTGDPVLPLKIVADRQEEWFDASGRLAKIDLVDAPGDSVVLNYCDQAAVSSGSCATLGTLRNVVDARGRVLDFIYSSASPALISEIRTNGVKVVEYGYDTNSRLTSVTWPDGAQRIYHYQEPDHLCKDASGALLTPCATSGMPNHLTGFTDELNTRVSTYTYDNVGRVTSSVWAGGAFPETLQYPSSTQRIVSLPSGTIKTFNFLSRLGFKKLDTSSDQDGVIDLSYDAAGRKSISKDKRMVETRYEYAGERVSVIVEAFGEPEQRRTEFDWDPVLDVTTEIRVKDAADVVYARTTLVSNSRRQVSSKSQVDPATGATRTTTTTYCEPIDVSFAGSECPILGLVKSVDGPRTDVADVTQFKYFETTDLSGCDSGGACHFTGDLHKIINPLGHVVERLRYDKSGRVLSEKDANGVVTEYNYDERGHLLTKRIKGTTAAQDAVVSFVHDAAGLLSRATNPDGDFIDYEYDDAHRLVAVENAAGERIEYVLDAAGSRTAETTKDPNGNVTRALSRVYDVLGRLDVELDAYSHDVDHDYDSNGNQIESIDQLGRKTTREFDPRNRLERTVQDDGGLNVETGFEYDVLDRLVQVTDPKGLDTVYTYSSLGDLTQQTSPDTGATQYTYDAAANQITKTDARTVVETRSYDALNRVVSITYPTSSLNVSYFYDQADGITGCVGSFPAGRLTRMTDGSGSTTYCYDRRGNVTRKIQITGAVSLAVSYHWTLGDRLSGMTLPSGVGVSYVRDPVGRVRKIGTQSGFVATQFVSDTDYLPFGPLGRIEFAASPTLDFGYDQNYRIDTIEGAGLSLEYGVDAAGNVAALATPFEERAYIYDPLYRLTSVENGFSQVVEEFSYDKTGNRTFKQDGGGPQSYVYPLASHRLTSVAGVSRSYDAMGNLIDRGDGWTFEYSDAQRLHRVRENGSLTHSSSYNALGERVAKSRGLELGGAKATYFLYDEDGHLLAEYFSDATAPQKQYIWLDDRLVGVLVSAGNYMGSLLRVGSDHLGAPRTLVTSSGDTLWAWPLEGNAFGEDAPLADPDGDNAALTLNLRYPGQYFDEASGLHYNYFRDYEPGTGRYVESDPIGLKGGMSTFAYSSSSPLNRTDPDGLMDLGIRCGYVGTGFSCSGPPAPPPTIGCEGRCNFYAGLICGPVASASGGSDMFDWAYAFTACRLAVFSACKERCKPSCD